MLLRFSYKDIWILERSILFLLDFTNPPQPITSPELAEVESKMDNTNITKNVQICFIVDLASFDKIDKNQKPGFWKKAVKKMWQTNTSVAELPCLLMINKGSNLSRSYIQIAYLVYSLRNFVSYRIKLVYHKILDFFHHFFLVQVLFYIQVI